MIVLELYSDREHTFTCDVKIEGSKYSKVTPRLVLATTKKNLFFEGKIQAGKCEIVVPPVSDIDIEGKVSLELIVDNALLKPWNSKYKIVSSIKSEAVDPKFYTKQLVESVSSNKMKSRVPKVVFEAPIQKKKSSMFNEVTTKNNRTLVSDLLTLFRTLNNGDRALVKEIARKFNPSKKTLHWANATFKDINRIEAKICMYEIEQYLQEPTDTKKDIPARDKAIPVKQAEKSKQYKKSAKKNTDISKLDRRVISQRIQSENKEISRILRKKKILEQKKKRSDLYRRMLML